MEDSSENVVRKMETLNRFLTYTVIFLVIIVILNIP